MSPETRKVNSMQLISADPRSLKENPDRSRQSKSSPQSDALLCASIKAIGVVQPPVVRLDPDGGNSYSGWHAAF